MEELVVMVWGLDFRAAVDLEVQDRDTADLEVIACRRMAGQAIGVSIATMMLTVKVSTACSIDFNPFYSHSCANVPITDIYRPSRTPQPAEFDEYDAGEDDDRSAAARNKTRSRTSAPPSSRSSRTPQNAPPAPAPKDKKPTPVVQDLFDFGDDDFSAPVSAPTPPVAAAPEPKKDIFGDDGELL